VHVLVPRFKFDTGYQVAGAVGELGLKRAFMNPLHDGGADFRGMTGSVEPDDQLYISGIFHKALVDVNEQGTEAAAASGLGICGAALGEPVTEPFTPVFKADSPFICIIRDRPTDTILFMGRVMDPG
jgi:serpin B